MPDKEKGAFFRQADLIEKLKPFHICGLRVACGKHQQATAPSGQQPPRGVEQSFIKFEGANGHELSLTLIARGHGEVFRTRVLDSGVAQRESSDCLTEEDRLSLLCLYHRQANRRACNLYRDRRRSSSGTQVEPNRCAIREILGGGQWLNEQAVDRGIRYRVKRKG